MGVYVKGMEMPTSCEKCELSCTTPTGNGTYRMCPILRLAWKESKPDPDCPLIEVPKHGRLGDLDRLEQMFVDIDNAPYSIFDGEELFYSAEDAAQIIRLAPTIIEAEEGE